MIYSQFSGDAAHPTITALARHWGPASVEAVYLDVEPEVDEGQLDETLHLGCLALISMMVVVNEMVGYTEAGKGLLQVNHTLKTLQAEKWGAELNRGGNGYSDGKADRRHRVIPRWQFCKLRARNGVTTPRSAVDQSLRMRLSADFPWRDVPRWRDCGSTGDPVPRCAGDRRHHHRPQSCLRRNGFDRGSSNLAGERIELGGHRQRSPNSAAGPLPPDRGP